MQNFISKLVTLTPFQAVLCLSIVTMVNVVFSSFIWHLNDAAVIAANMMGLLILAYFVVFPNPRARLTHTASEFPLLDAMAIVVVTAWAAKFAHGVVIEEEAWRHVFNAFLVFLGAISFMHVKQRYELGDRMDDSRWNDLQEARLHNLAKAYLTISENLIGAARRIMIFAKSNGRPDVDDTMAGVNRFCVDDEFRQEMLKWLKVHYMQTLRDSQAMFRPDVHEIQCVLEYRALLASVEEWEMFQTLHAETRATTTFTMKVMTTSKAA